MEKIDMSLWSDIKGKLEETVARIEELREAKETVENILFYISELNLPDGINDSHHAEMEYNDVHSEIEDELEELERKVAQL